MPRGKQLFCPRARTNTRMHGDGTGLGRGPTAARGVVVPTEIPSLIVKLVHEECSMQHASQGCKKKNN